MTTKYKPPRLRNLKPDKRKGRKKRYLLIPLFLVLLLGAGVLLMLRWRAWFGNPPEATILLRRSPASRSPPGVTSLRSGHSPGVAGST